MTSIQKVLQDKAIIHCDSEIMSGTPVFTGTRVPLKTFFDYLEGEAGLAEFLADFPHLQDKVFQILEITMRAILEKERIDLAHSA